MLIQVLIPCCWIRSHTSACGRVITRVLSGRTAEYNKMLSLQTRLVLLMAEQINYDNLDISLTVILEDRNFECVLEETSITNCLELND